MCVKRTVTFIDWGPCLQYRRAAGWDEGLEAAGVRGGAQAPSCSRQSPGMLPAHGCGAAAAPSLPMLPHPCPSQPGPHPAACGEGPRTHRVLRPPRCHSRAKPVLVLGGGGFRGGSRRLARAEEDDGGCREGRRAGPRDAGRRGSARRDPKPLGLVARSRPDYCCGGAGGAPGGLTGS